MFTYRNVLQENAPKKWAKVTAACDAKRMPRRKGGMQKLETHTWYKAGPPGVMGRRRKHVDNVQEGGSSMFYYTRIPHFETFYSHVLVWCCLLSPGTCFTENHGDGKNVLCYYAAPTTRCKYSLVVIEPQKRKPRWWTCISEIQHQPKTIFIVSVHYRPSSADMSQPATTNNFLTIKNNHKQPSTEPSTIIHSH